MYRILNIFRIHKKLVNSCLWREELWDWGTKGKGRLLTTCTLWQLWNWYSVFILCIQIKILNIWKDSTWKRLPIHKSVKTDHFIFLPLRVHWKCSGWSWTLHVVMFENWQEFYCSIIIFLDYPIFLIFE